MKTEIPAALQRFISHDRSEHGYALVLMSDDEKKRAYSLVLGCGACIAEAIADLLHGSPELMEAVVNALDEREMLVQAEGDVA
jgi:lysine/ornithine N-monooxygenase